MPRDPISAEKQRRIVELWEHPEVEHKTTVAEEVGVSRSTVNTYLEKYEDGELDVDPRPNAPPPGVDRPDGGDEDDEHGEYTNKPPSGSEGGDSELEGMSKKEFILWFFDKRGHGVKSDFAHTLADMCEVRDELPNETKLVNLVLDGNTGVANESDASMLGSNYAAAKKRYFDVNEQVTPSDGGSWVDEPHSEFEHEPSDAPRGRGAADGGGGEWGGHDQGRDRVRGRGGGRGGGRGDRSGRGQGGRRRSGGGRGGRGGRGGEISQLREEIRELKEAQMQMMQGGQQQNGSGSLKDQVQEIAEINSTLEQLQGGDGSDEEIQALRDQMQQIQSEVQRAAQADGDAAVQAASGEGGNMAVLAQMAQNEDVDTETLAALGEMFGATDPEVKVAEYEFKAEQQRMENRRQMVDQIFDNLGDVSGDIVGAAFEALTGDDGEEPSKEEVERAVERIEQSDNPAQDEIARHNQSGEIRDIGGGEEQENPQGEQNVSPARERFESRGGDQGRDPGPSGGFRGPTDQARPGEGCQFVYDDGSQCGEPTPPGEVMCDEHLGGAAPEVE